ncbi:hypothetical protein MRY87_03170 [bacterium]|nr:hypothetical protein [bacterium]
MRKKRNWKPLYRGQIDDFRPSEHANDWKDLSTEEKFRQVTALAMQVIEMKGKSYEDVSGLLRTTAVIKRA